MATAEIQSTVLVIEDDPKMQSFLTALLEGHGYRVFIAETGAQGITEVATRNPDVVLLDLGLPDLDGLTVTRRVRGWTVTPIIVISAREMEQDKVAALDLGADDYLTKPFGSEELLARVRVALRHSARLDETGEATFVVGELEIDLGARRVTVEGKPISLTPLEYKLLTTLARHAGKVLSHKRILEEVWGLAYSRETHYVRVYMAHLRRKIEKDSTRPRYLLTETGVGYRLAAE